MDTLPVSIYKKCIIYVTNYWIPNIKANQPAASAIVLNHLQTCKFLPASFPSGEQSMMVRTCASNNKLLVKMTTTHCSPQDIIWEGGIDHVLVILPNQRATERGVLKTLYKPMTIFHDNSSPWMEEQICGKVEHPKSCAWDSPVTTVAIFLQ